MADINGFGNFSGFTINQNDSGATPSVSIPNDSIQLVNGGVEKRSIIFETPQAISAFTASFTATAQEGDGACFVLENNAAGANAVGGFAGYSGMTNSAAVGLLIFTATTGGTGLFTNGSIGVNGGSSSSPVALNVDPISVSLTYDGTILSETLTDAKKGTTFSTSYLVNLPSLLGSSTAFVGFTAGATVDPGQGETISNFQFTNSVPEPASCGLLAVGAITAMLRRCRKQDAKGIFLAAS
jgi:hypothetical protein